MMTRISPKDYDLLMNAYSKVHSTKLEPKVEEPEVTSSDGINIDGESSE